MSDRLSSYCSSFRTNSAQKERTKKIWWFSVNKIQLRTLLQRDYPVRFLVAEIQILIPIYGVLLPERNS
jgi:hypothetical protein